jgi:hypothetical protein
MTNAKDELIKILEGLTPIAAEISVGPYYWDESHRKKIRLKEHSTHDDWLNFLEDLDFEYDSNYGSQQLFGTVWLSDGTWLERYEYDGSEWWDHKAMPPIKARVCP